MPYDENGLFTWCLTFQGDGCPECDDGFDAPDDDDTLTMEEFIVQSSLCDPSSVIKEDDETQVIPW